MKNKKVVCILFLFVLLFTYSSKSLASGFTDMPNNWSTEALEKAVENGLIKGDNGKIRAGDSLSRAEMATIINRAFVSEEKALLGQYNDVKEEDWYYSDLSKAVASGILKGDGKNLNPMDKITREEAFIIIFRALDLEESIEKVDGYLDLESISAWAKSEVHSLINAGYIDGSAGKINPKGHITRAEFAQLMDNIIKDYISEAGDYNIETSGNLIINEKGVTLSDSIIDGDLIIRNGNISLENVDVKGKIRLRASDRNDIEIKNSKLAEIKVSKLRGRLDVNNLKLNKLNILDGSLVKLSDSTEVEEIKLNGDTRMSIDSGVNINKLKIEGDRVNIKTRSDLVGLEIEDIVKINSKTYIKNEEDKFRENFEIDLENNFENDLEEDFEEDFEEELEEDLEFSLEILDDSVIESIFIGGYSKRYIEAYSGSSLDELISSVKPSKKIDDIYFTKVLGAKEGRIEDENMKIDSGLINLKVLVNGELYSYRIIVVNNWDLEIEATRDKHLFSIDNTQLRLFIQENTVGYLLNSIKSNNSDDRLTVVDQYSFQEIGPKEIINRDMLLKVEREGEEVFYRIDTSFKVFIKDESQVEYSSDTTLEVQKGLKIQEFFEIIEAANPKDELYIRENTSEKIEDYTRLVEHGMQLEISRRINSNSSVSHYIYIKVK